MLPDRRFFQKVQEQRKRPLTEADLLGVRFPHSAERIGGVQMLDDERITALANPYQTLFILVEVKNDVCSVNGPWTDKQQANMQRVIRRLGFPQEEDIEGVAERMYDDLRCDYGPYVLQYMTVGNHVNHQLNRQYPKLVQITFEHIAEFMYARFDRFREKLPPGSRVHQQWPDFGKQYGQWFKSTRRHSESCLKPVSRYIEEGWCIPHRKPAQRPGGVSP